MFATRFKFHPGTIFQDFKKKLTIIKPENVWWTVIKYVNNPSIATVQEQGTYLNPPFRLKM